MDNWVWTTGYGQLAPRVTRRECVGQGVGKCGQSFTHSCRSPQAVIEEQDMSPEKRIVANVGKMDAKKHLAANVTSVMASNINQALGTMLDVIVF